MSRNDVSAAESWSRKNEDKLVMIEQLQRELTSTVDALSLEQSRSERPVANGFSYAVPQPLQSVPVHLATTSVLSMPQNKFGYQDNMSMLEFLRSSQEALARLQVEHQLLLAQCQDLKSENLLLRDQNKRLLQDQEHLSAARTNAEGKLSFRFRQVMELEDNAIKAEQRMVNLQDTIKGQNERAAKLTAELQKSDTDLRVANVRNAYLEARLLEQKKINGVPLEVFQKIEKEHSEKVESLEKQLSSVKHRYGEDHTNHGNSAQLKAHNAVHSTAAKRPAAAGGQRVDAEGPRAPEMGAPSKRAHIPQMPEHVGGMQPELVHTNELHPAPISHQDAAEPTNAPAPQGEVAGPNPNVFAFTVKRVATSKKTKSAKVSDSSGVGGVTVNQSIPAASNPDLTHDSKVPNSARSSSSVTSANNSCMDRAASSKPNNVTANSTKGRCDAIQPSAAKTVIKGSGGSLLNIVIPSAVAKETLSSPLSSIDDSATLGSETASASNRSAKAKMSKTSAPPGKAKTGTMSKGKSTLRGSLSNKVKVAAAIKRK